MSTDDAQRVESLVPSSATSGLAKVGVARAKDAARLTAGSRRNATAGNPDRCPPERERGVQSELVAWVFAAALNQGKGHTQRLTLGAGFLTRGKIAQIPSNSAHYANIASAQRAVSLAAYGALQRYL